MISQTAIIELINDKLEEDGFFLVSVDIKLSNAIVVFIDGDNGVPIEYCVTVSRLIEHSLDREVEDFSLEVSSAGIGKPFKVLRQYLKNVGKEVEVISNDKAKITGILTEASELGFKVKEEKMIKPEGKRKKELQEIVHQFNFEDIKSVKELIKF